MVHPFPTEATPHAIAGNKTPGEHRSANVIRAARNLRHDNQALLYFAGSIASHYGLHFERVIDELETVSGNMLDLAYSPQGLTALADAIACQLGASDCAPLMPAIH